MFFFSSWVATKLLNKKEIIEIEIEIKIFSVFFRIKIQLTASLLSLLVVCVLGKGAVHCLGSELRSVM